MTLLKRAPKGSRPERKPPKPLSAREQFQAARLAASAEGKTLGEWLYEAHSEAFGFTSKWSVPGKAETRKKYSAAADAFAKRLLAALRQEAPP